MDLELKVLRVIESCETEEQLKAAKNYLFLYFKQLKIKNLIKATDRLWYHIFNNKATELANKLKT